MLHIDVVPEAGEGTQQGHETEQMPGGPTFFPDVPHPPDGTFIVPPRLAWRKGMGTLRLGAHAYVKWNILILPSRRKHLKYII